jgi:hypothetical protein
MDGGCEQMAVLNPAMEASLGSGHRGAGETTGDCAATKPAGVAQTTAAPKFAPLV